MKLAILNCKKSKATKPCTVREMYWPSAMFRAQVEFCEAYYDKVLVLSYKNLLMELDDIIEPYELNISGGYAGPDPTKIESGNWSNWAFYVNLSLLLYDNVDFHISNIYWKHLKPYNLGRKINLPPNTGFVVNWYQRLLRDYQSGLEVNFVYVDNGERITSLEKHHWIHPVYGEFYGSSYEMHKHIRDNIDPKVDLSTLHRVAGYPNGKPCKSHKGWTIDKKKPTLDKLL